jgi:hypothetical protein
MASKDFEVRQILKAYRNGLGRGFHTERESKLRRILSSHSFSNFPLRK